MAFVEEIIILLSCFQESNSPPETPYLCCDICEKLCKCLVCKDKPFNKETECCAINHTLRFCVCNVVQTK